MKSNIEDGYGFRFLYGEIVITKDGVKVLSFNARLAEILKRVCYSRLESDFVENILRVMSGKEPKLEVDEKVSVGVVLASRDIK